VSYFRSKTLEAARVLAAKDWSNPKVIAEIRAMLRDGMTSYEIADVLGWDASTLRGRMRRLGLESLAYRKAHHGIETTLPHAYRGISGKPYKPREVTS
jgi:hypothetical protein